MTSLRHVLVVDADIARAAGPDPKERPWSELAKVCHDVLAAVRRCRGYRAAFDPMLRAEWKKHQGRTGSKWFAEMLSARRLQIVRDAKPQWVSDLIQALPQADRPTATKDRHLVALAHDPGDKRLLSGDSKAREKFSRISDARVSEIHWVPPSIAAVRWLLDGALSRAEWTLGYQENDA